MNNHQMKTTVETFFVEETQDLIHDTEQLARYNELVTSLGLTGQTMLQSDSKSPIPFMHMKQGLRNVFETLCPQKIDVERFSITPIPLPLMELIALSVREQYFTNIQVWWDDRSLDPVIVGILAEVTIDKAGSYEQLAGTPKFKTVDEAKGYMVDNNIPDINHIRTVSWNAQYYLIGRWADVKADFAELTKRAKERFIEKETATARKDIKRLQMKIDSINDIANEQFS